MNIVTENPLETDVLFEKLRKAGAGSVIFHYAIVKNTKDDKPSAGIRFEKTGNMEAEMSKIENDVRKRWRIDDILLVRRLGCLQVGDMISLVAVSAQKSLDAFEACQYGLACIRKMASIKKNELFKE